MMTPTGRRLPIGLVAAMMFAGSATVVGADLPVDRNVGRRLPDFTLKVAGEETPVRLYSLARDKTKKVAVLVFTGTACPVAEVYLPRLNELAKTYGPRGVTFLAINANAHETADDVAKHAKEHALGFPVLKDPSNLVADMALIQRTPEVVVLDGTATIRYRGAIDDQYAVGSRKPEPTHRYLADALDALLGGQPVAVRATEVAGCPLDRVDPAVAKTTGPRVRTASPEILAAREAADRAAGPVEVGRVTYAANVAPILAEKCQGCHRPGQSAPFALSGYDEARKWSAAIAEVVDDRRMPPWHADPRHGQFQNDRSLTPKQRATLLAWIEQGTPLGDPADLPKPARFPEGWTIGTPDVVIESPEPYTIPAQGVIDYIYIKVPTNFTEDRWVQAAEAAPTDRSAVHHIIAFVDPPKEEAKAGGRPTRIHLCGYAPGDMPSIYPEGVAKKIPAGSSIVFQVHYTPNGKVRTDRTRLGLIFARSPVKHEAHTLAVANPRFAIQPGDPNAEVKSSHTVRKDAHILAFMPHMHLRGKDFKYTYIPKDGPERVLLSVPGYDFGWQSFYYLSQPLAVHAGDRIDCVAHFDNSKGNPANPDPTKTVTWGDQTFEEMMIGYVDYYDDAEVSPAPKVAQVPR